MPWNNRDYIQLGFLICCLPLQFYLSNYKASNVDISGFTNYFSSITDISWLINLWMNFWKSIVSWLVTNVLEASEGVNESPAIEVFEYRKKHNVPKKEPRKVKLARPEGLWFRVGQVVEHLYKGYKGVIVEWEFDPEKSSSPLYKILVDERTTDDTEFAGIVEVEQEMLYLLKHTQIVNRHIKNYFTAFDGSQYIPQPWLQELFPKD